MLLEPYSSKLTSNTQDYNQFPAYDLSDPNSFDLLGIKACKGMGTNVSQIAFIDPTVPNYQTLLEAIHPSIQFVVLDANKNGVQQITDALTDGKYSAVHIISHGNSGSIGIGRSHLGYDNITDYASELQEWKDALTPDADILLYGCNVANLSPQPPLLQGEGAQDTPPSPGRGGGQGGEVFLSHLAELTGADIAASDDLTGNAALGGDWILEYTSGKIETPVALQDRVMAAYSSTLDNTYHALASGAFTQNWSNTGLITTNDNWSGVPSIIGYLGDDSTTTATGIDPQTILDPRTTTVDVIANQANPNTLTAGGVAEFEITNPTVALQGSGTADAPFILVHLDTRGTRNIQVSYNLRDLDGSANNANQSLALQYRFGTSGNFINVPAGYVADASTGPSLATLVTPVSVTLPAAVDNQAQVQVRIITTNAGGSDEWIGIDDINIRATLLNTAPILDLNGAASGINYNTTFTRAGGAVGVVDSSNLSLTDDGNTISSATVRITNLQNAASEVLNVVTTGTNISANYNNGILNLTGSDTVANYQQILRSITYNNTAIIPNTTSRNIEFVVNDGSLNSTVATTTLAINLPTTNLGSNIVAGTRSRPPVFNLNNTTSEVLYSLNLSTATRIVANLMMNGGNADLALLDSSGVIIASSTNGGTLAEKIDRAGLSYGNYFIRVYQAIPSQTVNYQLSVNFA